MWASFKCDGIDTFDSLFDLAAGPAQTLQLCYTMLSTAYTVAKQSCEFGFLHLVYAITNKAVMLVHAT